MRKLSATNTFWETYTIDYYRNTGHMPKIYSVISTMLRRRNSPLNFIFTLRAVQYGENVMMRKIAGTMYRHYSVKFGYEIPVAAEIGEGLRLPHYAGGIVIHPNAKIGRNCEIMQGVTIGNNIQKDRYAVAEIGDNVILCSGAKIIGKVKIGNNVIVGANAVVTHDIPDNCIVGGGTCKDNQV